MRNVHAAVLAAGLSLAPAAAAALEYDRAFYFAGCNLQQTCATATLFLKFVDGAPADDAADIWVEANVVWNDGVGGGLVESGFLSTTPYTYGFWDSHSDPLCEYPRSEGLLACWVRWDTPLGQRVPLDYRPTGISFLVGYGADDRLEPTSVAELNLTTVPEPATVALLGGGLALLGVGGAMRRRVRDLA